MDVMSEGLGVADFAAWAPAVKAVVVVRASSESAKTPKDRMSNWNERVGVHREVRQLGNMAKPAPNRTPASPRTSGTLSDRCRQWQSDREDRPGARSARRDEIAAHRTRHLPADRHAEPGPVVLAGERAVELHVRL